MGEGSHRVIADGAGSTTPRLRSWTGVLRHVLAATLLLARGALGAAAQEPPDSVVRDSLAARTPIDTLAVGNDTTAAVTDTTPPLVFHNLPVPGGEEPAGWVTGVWTWTHDDLQAGGARTLGELLADVPGLLTLYGGDYGTPLAVSAFGIAGGGVRVVRDGFELYPVEGGVVDLARIGLGGISRVRLDRTGGEMLIEMFSKGFDDGRPYSLIEAGTGDLDTNVFRGTFANPSALGGSVALALERTDTRGPGGDERGNRTGTWLRYALHRGDDAAVAIDFRRMGTETELTDYAAQVIRTDWAVRGSANLAEGLVGEIYTGRSTHDVDDGRDAYALEGGTRSQQGLRLSFERSGVWARGAYRRFGGDDVLTSRMDLAGGVTRTRVGGASASVDRASWGGTATSALRYRAWTEPLMGLSLFAARASGTSGARLSPLLDVVPAPDSTAIEPADSMATAPQPTAAFAISDRTFTRYGAALSWRGAMVSGAKLEMEADSLIPFGIEPDRGQSLLLGGVRTGWEVAGSVPMGFMPGLTLEGSLQQWEEPGAYLPERIYRGAFVFHRTFMESENFELWWTLGVRGNDPMTVHILGAEDAEGARELLSVPFYQNWYGRIQARVVTVKIFIGWENFTIRRDLQTFPGRVLPATRAFYGIRWTMHN